MILGQDILMELVIGSILYKHDIVCGVETLKKLDNTYDQQKWLQL